MGLAGFLGTKIKYGAFNLGDAISRRATRANTHVRGFFQGENAFYKLRAGMKTFYGREMADVKGLKGGLRDLCRARSHLQRFSEEKLTTLSKRYADHPKTFTHRICALIQDFNGDLEDFVYAYEECLSAANDQLLRMDYEKAGETGYIGDVLVRLLEIVRKNAQDENLKSYVPEGVLDDTLSKLNMLNSKKIKVTKRSVRDDRRALRGKERKGLWGFMGNRIAGSRLIFGIKGKLKFWKRSELKDIRENLKLIEGALEQNSIDITLFSRLLDHLKKMGKVEELFYEMSHDVRVFLDILDDYDKEVETQVALFVGAVQNVPGVDTTVIGNELNKLTKVRKRLEKICKIEVVDERRLKDQLVELQRQAPAIIDELKTLFGRIKSGIEQNPDKALEQFAH